MALDGTVQRQLGGRAAVISSLKFLDGATQPMAIPHVADTGHIVEINNMSLKLLAVAALFAFTSVPAMAVPMSDQVLSSGDNTVISGRAHVYEGALGTYIAIERPDSVEVAGVVAFGDGSTFPDLWQLEGQKVQISGVVGLYGIPLIAMTDPDQLRVME